MKTSSALRKKRTALLLLAVILLAAAALAALTLLNARSHQGETIRGSLEGRLTGTPRLDIDGSLFTYNRDLVNILVMGIDRAAGEDRQLSLRSNGQADFLLLITIDEKARTVGLLHIDRDTMADITILSVLGQDAGTRLAQICLAHGFGGTRDRSSQLTVTAVSKLLYGVPIDRYVSISMSDVGAIADSLGGVPVIMEEDLTNIDPGFVKGAEVLLTGEQANRFVRNRYDVSDGSNQARMGRQQLFMTSFQSKLKAELDKGQSEAEKLYDQLSPYLFTSLTKGYIINVLNRTRGFSVGGISTVEGIHRVGDNGFMEFHADKSDLQRYVRTTFTLED